jgi:HK97 family phage major capsid protein
MRKFGLSANFLFVVMALVAYIPLALDFSPVSIVSAGTLLLGSTLFVEKGVSHKRSAFGQLGEIGESKIAKEYEKVQSDLKKVGDDLKAYAETSQKEIKAAGKMSEETKASVDKLLIQQGELQARLAAAEQVVAKLEAGGGDVAKPQSAGELVIASDAYKNFNSSMQGSFTVRVNNAITSIDDSAGPLIQPQRLGMVQPTQQRLFIRDLLSWGRTVSNSLEYVRESGFTNSAAPVSENPASPKPESDITFELDQDPVATIAHWIRASKQVLSDAPMLTSYIDGRLRYGLKLKEELQLLKGSGVGLNINGIYTQASEYSNPGVVVEHETMIDRLRIAILQAELAEYSPDGLVLSPIDWATIELTKDSTNRYLFASLQGLAVPMLWGRPIVASKSMDAGDFLVGSFQQGAQGWDREDASVTVSNQDRDNFVKNMVTILCEERVGLTVFRPEAFVKGDFDGLPVT